MIEMKVSYNIIQIKYNFSYNVLTAHYKFIPVEEKTSIDLRF